MPDNLPPGFVLDDTPAAPSVAVPPGFALDDPAAAQAPPASPSRDLWSRGVASGVVPTAPTLSGLVTGQAMPDKYQQAAIADRDQLLKVGAPLSEGLTRRVVSGPMLGWLDELSAAGRAPAEMVRHGTFNPLEGYRYGKARENLATQAASENTGLTGDVAEGVSGLAMMPGNFFGREAAAALGGAGKGVLPALGRMAGYGAEGGTLGAIQGAGNAPTMADVPKEAGKGFVLGSALSAPFGHFADVAPRSTAKVPTNDELMALGSRDFKARDRTPVRYDLGYVANRMEDLSNANRIKYGRDAPETVNALNDRVAEARADVARANALNPNAAPGAVTAPGQVSGAANPWQAVATPRDIASLRREIYDAGAAGTPTDTRAGTISSKVVDRILSRPDPASLASGSQRDAATAALLDARGRGNFAGAYRDQAVRDAIDKSTAQAAGQHSGLNFENILRQNLRQARAKEQFGNLRPDEEAALETLIHGTVKANSIREVGNMLGGGGGLGRMIAMGGGAGGGAMTAYLTGNDPLAGAALGLGAGMTGRGLRTYGNAQALKAAEEFSDQIRRRTPEYRSRAATAPMGPGPGLGSFATGTSRALTLGGGGGVRDAIANALLYNATGQRQGQQ